MKLRASLLLGIATPFISAAAMAGQASETAPQGAAVAEDRGIEDIVVTARRTNESAQKVPLSISVLSPQAVRDANITVPADVSRLVPNFNIATALSDTSALLFTIRGQAQQDILLTTEPTIGIYVDGVNYIRSSNLQAVLVDVERIEVLKGPQGTLFGKNTTGGAVNITTRQADLSGVAGYVRGTVGNYGRRDLTGVVNIPIVNDKLAFRLVGHHTEHDGYGKNINGQPLGDINLDAFRANILFEPSDTVRWSGSADYNYYKSNGPPIRIASVNPYPSTLPGTQSATSGFLDIALATGLITRAQLADPVANAAAIQAALLRGRNILASYQTSNRYSPPAGEDSFVTAKTYGVSSNLSIDISSALQIRSITAARWMRRTQLLDLDGSPFRLVAGDFAADARNLSQELQLAQQNGGAFQWILGGYVNQEKGNEASVSLSLPNVVPAASYPGIFDGGVTNSSVAAFGQATYQLTDAFSVTGGLRYTQETKELRSRNRAGPTGGVCAVPVSVRVNGQCLAVFKDKFDGISYLASVNWQVDPGLLMFAKTSRGFKGGGQNLRGNAASVTSFLAFKPEQVTDYELGFKADLLDRKLRINGAVFYSDYKDIQRTITLAVANALATLITNAAKARIQGAEIDITARPIPQLTLTASGGITDAKYKSFVDVTGDRTGERFAFPKYNFALSGTYEVPTSVGAARFSANYAWQSSQQYAPAAKYFDSIRQPSYGLLGARAALNIEGAGIDVAIFGRNITNKRYDSAGGSFDNSIGFNTLYAGEPRTYGLEITKNF